MKVPSHSYLSFHTVTNSGKREILWWQEVLEVLALASLTPNTPIHHSFSRSCFSWGSEAVFFGGTDSLFYSSPPLHTMERLAIEAKCDAASYHPLPEVCGHRGFVWHTWCGKAESYRTVLEPALQQKMGERTKRWNGVGETAVVQEQGRWKGDHLGDR